MPYCPDGHGYTPDLFCKDCGAPTVAAPPAASDKISVRSPEAQASASANPHIYLPGALPAAAPLLLKCPQCGRRNLEADTFDCMGECGRGNLCHKHFDEEHEVCVLCARKLRKLAEQEAQRWQALTAERDQWSGQAQQAQAQAAALQADLDNLRRQLAQAQQTEKAMQGEAQALTAEHDQWSSQAQQAQAQAAALQADLDNLRRQLAQAQQTEKAMQGEVQAAQKRVQALEKELAGWRQRAEQAEAKLAASAQAEAQKRAEAEALRKKAEEAQRAAKKAAPVWQQIGIELIEIPAGEFLYGEKKEKRSLGQYSLAKTPVTNAQYKAFVDASGHPHPEHWQNGAIPAGKENHPVVYVSWEDAQAFCRWAGLRLPSEQEWEKGARGREGRTYPWGNQTPDANLCNFNGNLQDTTPVDRYPSGASPYGLLDMSGNVWEWCEDWYTEGISRVLRGGSWGNNDCSVRSATRLNCSPDSRDDGVGFRCARS